MYFSVPLLPSRPLYAKMSFYQLGILPDPASDTKSHFLALPNRPHTLDDYTYTGNLVVWDVVEWARGLDGPFHLLHIDIPQRAGALCKKEVGHAVVVRVASGPAQLVGHLPNPRPEEGQLLVGHHVNPRGGENEVSHCRPHYYYSEHETKS